MWIYKITNSVNSKVYIGQTIRPVEDRFRRHILDAIHNKLNTHFARAIRKYGPESFKIEIIDSATTQNELNRKEQEWIRRYNSIACGYNETDALYKCGGNTYSNKDEDEMLRIKDRIRETKIGSLNPNSRKIVLTDIIGCARAIGIKNGKTSITQRLNGQVSKPLYNRYVFEYFNE